MATNTKIRTEDVVEILDTKIKTSSAHAQLDVNVDEFYDIVLSKIAARVPTLDEKHALENTTFPPSASNPYVTVDELSLEMEGAIPWKTIGNTGSGADFVGDDEAPFLAAFATAPSECWFYVLAGTYTFTAAVSIPDGVRLVGEHPTNTIIASNVGSVFILSDNAYISHLNIISTDSASPAISVANTTTTEIRNCLISATSTSQTIDVTNATKFTLCDSALFFGSLSGASLTHSSIANSYTDTTGVNSISLLAPEDVVIWGNIFQAGSFALDGGTNIRVVGNHFNNAISNINPVDSVIFRANTPSSNNNEDEALTSLLQYIGSPSVSQSTPSYSNNFAGPQAQNLTDRASALDLLLQWKYEERNFSLIAAYDRTETIEIAQGHTDSLVNLGDAEFFMQTFVPLKTSEITEISLYFNKIGTLQDYDVTIHLVDLTLGLESPIFLSQVTVPSSAILTGVNSFSFPEILVTSGTLYGVRIQIDNYIEDIDQTLANDFLNLDTPDHIISQSFTPAISSKISSVTLELSRVGSLAGTDIVAVIVPVPFGEPATVGVISAPVAVDSLVPSPAFGSVEFTFPSTQLIAGLAYAISLQYVVPASPDGSNYVQCHYSNTDAYSNGHVFITTNSGMNWTSYVGYDLRFTTQLIGYDPTNYIELVGSSVDTYAGGQLYQYDLSLTGLPDNDLNIIIDLTPTEPLVATWNPTSSTLSTSKDMYLISAHRHARWVIPELAPTVIPTGYFLYYILDRSLSEGTGDIILTPYVVASGNMLLDTNPPTGHPDNRQIICLAFNHEGTLWWRGGGGTRFSSGMVGEYFVDGTSKNILTYLGASDYNDSTPEYAHNFAGYNGESLTTRLSNTDTLIKRLFEHSNLSYYLDDDSYMHSSILGNLTLTGLLYFTLPSKQGRIIVNPQTWTLADGQLLYFSWDHTQTIDQVASTGVDTTVPLPDVNLTTKYFVAAKRQGDIITLWDGTRLAEGGKWPVATNRQVVAIDTPATLYDNIVWDGTNVLWENLALICDGITLESNLIPDQLSISAGLTDLISGEGLLITHTWVDQSPSSKYVTIEKVSLPLPLLESNQFLWIYNRENFLIIT